MNFAYLIVIQFKFDQPLQIIQWIRRYDTHTIERYIKYFQVTCVLQTHILQFDEFIMR